MRMMSWCAAALLAVTTAAGAAQMPPAPEPLLAPLPEETIVMSTSSAVELYHCVKYKDLKNIAPCAVEKIVAVPDPCPDPCNTCSPQCVYVKVCVPPCDCYETKCKRRGKKIVMDFGKYQVEITSARGEVVVDYDD